MRSSSGRQQEFDFIEAMTPGASVTSSGAAANTTVQGMAVSPTQNTATNMALPNFGMPTNLYAIANRRAARLNAATISDTERDEWLTERQLLLDRKFDGTMTRADEVRLEYVRWQLDRIEDAKHGESLDMLESIVLQYEQFKSDLEELQSKLTKHKRGTRR